MILAADVLGYGRLMSADKAETIATLITSPEIFRIFHHSPSHFIRSCPKHVISCPGYRAEYRVEIYNRVNCV